MERKRTYRMKERARAQEETRQRIVEATMQLHEELGPRATTISAIADRAGVQRLTVYRHFPDEAAVFQACTSRWLELHPMPDPAEWAAVADPLERLGRALAAFYRYYGATRRMWTAAYRDVGEVPALQGPMAETDARLADIAGDLAAGFGARGQAAGMIEATIGHALAFATWSELDSRGLDEKAKVALVLSWARGCAAA